MSVAGSFKTLSNKIKAKLSQSTALPDGYSSENILETSLGVSLIYLADKVTANEPEINIAASLETLDQGIKEHFLKQPDSRDLLCGDFFYSQGLRGICSFGSLSDVNIVSLALAKISQAFANPIKTIEALYEAASLWRAAAAIAGIGDKLYEDLALILGAERLAKELKMEETILDRIFDDKRKRLEALASRVPKGWQSLVEYHEAN